MFRSIRSPLLAVLASVILLTAACSSDDGDDDGDGSQDDTTTTTTTVAPDPDPAPATTTAEDEEEALSLAAVACQYFNLDALADMVGEPVSSPEVRGRTCSVRAVDPLSSARVSVEVFADSGAYDRLLARHTVDETLDGLGDEAFLADTTVVMRSGETVMSVTATGDVTRRVVVDPADVVVAAEVLAAQVF